MYHSITFGDKNTWDDWHLVPASRPTFSMPPLQERYVDIPGLNGPVDLTEAITGYPVYGNRTGSFEFIVMNDWYEADGRLVRGNWQYRYSEIANYLHGQHMQAQLEDDPEYYYEGRFKLAEWRSEKDYSRISIEYSVGPYKTAVETTTEPWRWDPFNFETGVISNGDYVSPIASVTKTVASLTTSATVIAFTTDETTAMGLLDHQPKFTVVGYNDARLIITYGDGAMRTAVLPHGESTVVPSLFAKQGRWYYNGLVCESISASAEAGTVSLTVDLHPYYEGACTFSNITIGTTPTVLSFSDDFPTSGLWPTYAAGTAPHKVEMSATGASITIRVEQDNQTVLTIPLLGNAGYFPINLILYRGSWLYNGTPATISAYTSSGTSTLSLKFRRRSL